jgi:hypothetical protein
LRETLFFGFVSFIDGLRRSLVKSFPLRPLHLRGSFHSAAFSAGAISCPILPEADSAVNHPTWVFLGYEKRNLLHILDGSSLSRAADRVGKKLQ